MDGERGRNIAVGVTTLAGLAGLAALLSIFGYVPALLDKGYEVRMHFPGAGGLSPGSHVRLHGIEVGTVTDVQLREPAGTGVMVTARMKQRVALPQTVQASLRSPMFGGTPSVALTVPPGEGEGPTLATDGSAVIVGRDGSLEARFTRQLSEALEGPTRDFQALKEQVVELGTAWTAVAKNIEALTRPGDPAAVDAGTEAAGLGSVLQRADARLAEMEQALVGLNAWVGDEQLRADLKTTVSNAAEASASLNQTIGRVERRIVALADDLSQVTASVQQVADAARAGDGTVGRLLNDPALYNNLNDSAQRLQKALDEVRLLVAKWKAEGLPVQF